MFVERVRRGPGEKMLQPEQQRHAETAASTGTMRRPASSSAGASVATPRAASHAVDEVSSRQPSAGLQTSQRGERDKRGKKRAGVEPTRATMASTALRPPMRPQSQAEAPFGANRPASRMCEEGSMVGAYVRASPPFAGWPCVRRHVGHGGVLAALERADVGDDGPAVVHVHDGFIGIHRAVAVGDHVVQVAHRGVDATAPRGRTAAKENRAAR